MSYQFRKNAFVFIEYNGKQHYEPVAFGNMTLEETEVVFERQKKYDKIKKDYCEKNNYSLLSICYKDFRKINEIVEDFLQESYSKMNNC